MAVNLKVPGSPLIVQFGSTDSEFQRVGNEYAKYYGATCIHFGRAESLWEVNDKIKRSDFALIWNGLQDNAPMVARLCKRFGIPHAFYEYGLLSQSNSWSVDLTGFCGDSFLCGPLSWVTEQDRQNFYKIRSKLQHRFKLEPDETVLVPLQIENDTQVLYNTPWRDMDEFMDFIEMMYPSNKVIFRTHPKSTAVRRKRKYPVVNGNDIDFLEMARTAAVVVGMTSTTLYEAGILGVPVIALGDHPLRTHNPLDNDNLFAAALAMRVPKTDPSKIAIVLERFGVHPKGLKST